MAMQARTIEGFRQSMKRSITDFYGARGLSGKNLYAFAQNLGKIATQMKKEGKSSDEIKKELQAQQTGVLQFPFKFETDPRIDESYLIVGPESLSPTPAYKGLFEGKIHSEGHYAGQGTRLGVDKPKFMLTPHDLSEISLWPQFEGLANLSVGERIFLTKLFEVYKLATQNFSMTEYDFLNIVRRLRFKIIVNEISGGPIVEAFIKNRFFRLDPRNVIFMYQAQHPTFEVLENGALRTDKKRLSQGNHGLIPFQAVLEKQWFRLVPNKSGGYTPESLAPTDYKEFQSLSEVEIIESVEDTTQYVQPYDYVYIASVLETGRDHGYQMAMQMVGQKEKKPQKGGFLAYLPELGRNVVIESNRAPNLQPAEIKILNRNRNAFYLPSQTEAAILESAMDEDLHPTFELVKGEIRIDLKIPQGDRNLYLKTFYFQSSSRLVIENLKDRADILPTLANMRKMEEIPGILAFARDFLKMKGGW